MAATQTQPSRTAPRVVEPQAGPQERFLATKADIAIYGGSAGSGKSYAALMEALRHVQKTGFYAVYFRRTTPQITNPGGLWDTSRKLYPGAGGRSKESPVHQWEWDSGSRVQMSHLQHPNSVEDWQGSQIPFICCEVGTRVRMADGSLTAVEKLAVGDVVQTLNGPRKVSKTFAPHAAECVSARVFDEDGMALGSQVHSAS